MALNPVSSGDSHNWNYSNPDNPGYSTYLIGTVINVQEVQAMEFGQGGRPTMPKFWPNSNQPMMNIRIIFAGEKGGIRTWTFQPASKAAKEGKKPSVHIDLFNLAGGKDMMDLVGKTIKVETVAPPAGFSYGLGKPRPWTVSEVPGVGPFQPAEEIPAQYKMKVVLADSAVSGGVVSAPQQYQAPAPTVVDGSDMPF